MLKFKKDGDGVNFWYEPELAHFKVWHSGPVKNRKNGHLLVQLLSKKSGETVAEANLPAHDTVDACNDAAWLFAHEVLQENVSRLSDAVFASLKTKHPTNSNRKKAK